MPPTFAPPPAPEPGDLSGNCDCADRCLLDYTVDFDACTGVLGSITAPGSVFCADDSTAGVWTTLDFGPLCTFTFTATPTLDITCFNSGDCGSALFNTPTSPSTGGCVCPPIISGGKCAKDFTVVYDCDTSSFGAITPAAGNNLCVTPVGGDNQWAPLSFDATTCTFSIRVVTAPDCTVPSDCTVTIPDPVTLPGQSLIDDCTACPLVPPTPCIFCSTGTTPGSVSITLSGIDGETCTDYVVSGVDGTYTANAASECEWYGMVIPGASITYTITPETRTNVTLSVQRDETMSGNVWRVLIQAIGSPTWRMFTASQSPFVSNSCLIGGTITESASCGPALKATGGTAVITVP